MKANLIEAEARMKTPISFFTFLLQKI